VKKLALTAVCCAISFPAFAADQKPLTVLQCISVMNGLEALRYAGAQVMDTRPTPPDAKQYKLGAMRFTIALDISQLEQVTLSVQKAQTGFVSELPSAVSPDPKNPDANAVRDRAIQANWDKLTSAECPVQPGHIKASDLKLGDGTEDNQIPPTVLSALIPIIDP
jgi:hypothetical protein